MRPSVIDGAVRDLPPWSEKEIARFAFRVALFQRRGIDERYAEELADRLFERDFEKDDRRVCVECKHLLRSGACAKRGPAMRDQLQRCDTFTWMTPND